MKHPCTQTPKLTLISPATLGYKQELRRHYSTTQVFAVAFSIMGLLPSIASTLSFSIPAGPVGIWKTLADSLSRVRLSWLTRATLQGADRVAGWLAASVFIFIVGLAMVCRVHRLSRPVHQSDNR